MLDRDLGWKIWSEPDDIGDRKQICFRSSPGLDYFLPAGRYQVRGQIDSASASKDIEIKPGQVTEERLVLNAGLATIGGAVNPGGPPLTRDIGWTIYEGRADVLGDRKRIIYRSGPTVEHFLPVGRYLATAVLGEMKGEKEFEVSAGKRAQVEVVLAR